MGKKKIIDRTKRIIGQLEAVSKKLEQDASCDVVITQLLAVRGGVDSCLRAYIQQQLDQCTAAEVDKMQKLMCTLLKKM